MNTRLRLAALLFLSSVLTGPALADASGEVRCHEIAFSQSVENQDLDAFASYIDNDGSWMVIFDAGSESAAAPSEEIQALLEQEVTCP